MSRMQKIIGTMIIISLMLVIWVLLPWGNNIDSQNAMHVKEHFNHLHNALDAFEADIGRCPTTEEGLNALLVCPTSVTKKNWRGPYFISIALNLEWDLSHISRDPWNNDYRYIYTPKKKDKPEHNRDYKIISAGRDGRLETQDDIVSSDNENDDNFPSCYNISPFKKLHDFLHEMIVPEYHCRS